ncbi:MAG: hypothetical protein ACOZE5_12505 [Verrucomicrobiota bacterium]
MKPTNAATYERARRLANQALWTVDLQCRRLESDEPGDRQFILRKWSDLHFLIVALTRLRRAAQLSVKVVPISADMRAALATFDRALPHLKKMRDVAEHIDEYSVDAGRDQSVSRKSLEVGYCDGETWQWLGYDLNPRAALMAGIELFEAIRRCGTVISTEPNKALEPTEGAVTDRANARSAPAPSVAHL